MKRLNRRFLLWLCAVALCATAFPAAAWAQDFYGEGNVLIAVDMGAYAENDEVDYPAGTMGTLQWGADAPTGVSTRPAFAGQVYAVSPDVTPVPAPAYAIKNAYVEGDTLIYPYYRTDDPHFLADEQWLPASSFPEEVFENGAPRFLIGSDCVDTEGDQPLYQVGCGKAEDGRIYPCADFLEIECVATTEYSTVWQYTGKVYSNREGFDAEDHVGAINMTPEEIELFQEACDIAYLTEAGIYGDPRWEDARGDCDGKVAYVALYLSRFEPDTLAYFRGWGTELLGFDCLVIGANYLPERWEKITSEVEKDLLVGTLAHELNHYIVMGCFGHEDELWNMWVGEAFADTAIYAIWPDNTSWPTYAPHITDDSSRLRLIPGMLWNYGASTAYPNYPMISYTLGSYFLRYIERKTTGQADGRLWTNYFAQRTPGGNITATELDGYLTETTGEGLDVWMARFMAAVVVGASEEDFATDEKVITQEFRVDPTTFFRPYEEYGAKLSFDGAADESIKKAMADYYDFSAVQGGGTTYAWRNDAGGKIAVTGADDRWYFFAANLDLPDVDQVIEIGSAEELAKIGREPGYYLSGRYRLTADLDLGGAAAPWSPIGTLNNPFTGVFDGNGHTIRGLYVNAPAKEDQGLFGCIMGNAEVRDLSVTGSVTANNRVGGIVGYMFGGTVQACASNVTVAGGFLVGGIAGRVGYNSTLQNCYNVGTVSGNKDVGGVVGGIGKAAAENCYSYQSGLPAVGSIHQDDDGNETATVTACYARSDTETGEGLLTTAQFAQQSSFEGWDFNTVWELSNGVRPVLRSNPETITRPSGGGSSGSSSDGSSSSVSASGSVTAAVSTADLNAAAASGKPVVLSVETAATKNAAEAVPMKITVPEAVSAQNPVTVEIPVRDLTAGTVAVLVKPDGTEEIIKASTVDAGGVVLTLTGSATIKIVDNSKSFDDVNGSEWYASDVAWAASHEVMNGVGGGSFDPGATTTTGMVAQILMNLAGASASPDTAAEAFSDVDAADWFAPAVSWLAETGIARGEGDAFGAEAPISRERDVVLLFNFARYMGCDTSARVSLDGFSDADRVSDWAHEAMEWAVAVGLINGTTDAQGNVVLDAQAAATRGQIAAITRRFCEKVARYASR